MRHRKFPSWQRTRRWRMQSDICGLCVNQKARHWLKSGQSLKLLKNHTTAWLQHGNRNTAAETDSCGSLDVASRSQTIGSVSEGGASLTPSIDSRRFKYPSLRRNTQTHTQAHTLPHSLMNNPWKAHLNLCSMLLVHICKKKKCIKPVLFSLSCCPLSLSLSSPRPSPNLPCQTDYGSSCSHLFILTLQVISFLHPSCACLHILSHKKSKKNHPRKIPGQIFQGLTANLMRSCTDTINYSPCEPINPLGGFTSREKERVFYFPVITRESPSSLWQCS